MKLSATGCLALLLALPPLVGCQVPGRLIGAAAALAPAAVSAIPTKLMFSCLPEGTPIDTPQGPRPVESIRPGEEVIGFDGEPVRVLQKHAYVEDPAAKRFHRITFDNGGAVDLCDMHRIDGTRARNVSPAVQIGGRTVKSIAIYGGVERSYDLLTEDAGYRISGLPVNSMIEEMAAEAALGGGGAGSGLTDAFDRGRVRIRSASSQR